MPKSSYENWLHSKYHHIIYLYILSVSYNVNNVHYYVGAISIQAQVCMINFSWLRMESLFKKKNETTTTAIATCLIVEREVVFLDFYVYIECQFCTYFC